jgi:hypothetical protein
MRILETELFLLQLPDEWEAEQDDETFVITDADEISTLEITPLKKESGLVADEDLVQFTADLQSEGKKGISSQLGDFGGECYFYEEEGAAWREWLVYAGDLILLITHGVEIENKGIDDSMVDDILSTLILVSPIDD